MVKTVAVTGAGGYVGRHVVSSLLRRGAQVVAVDRVEPDVDPRAQTLVADIFHPNSELYELLGRPDAVAHLAWRNGFAHNDDSHIDDLPGHFHLVKNLLDAGLPQLAIMGTMHEVGYHEGPITAETPCAPASLYGIAKNTLRQIAEVLAAQRGAKLQWIRAFYIVGDDTRSNSIFAKILAAADSGQKTFPFTSGKNKFDFISVEELADQIAVILLQDQVTGIINACSGEPVSLAERVESYIAEHKLGLELEYGAFPDREYDSPGVWGDASQIRELMTVSGETDARLA